MSEAVPIVATLNEKDLYGRMVLFTSVDGRDVNEYTIPAILEGVQVRHAFNVVQINKLLEEYLGKQEILKRERDFAINTINNKIVVNRAEEIVRKSVGYFLGEPISYTSRLAKDDEEASSAIEDLNVYMDEEDKAAKDIELGEWASICGTAYRLVMTNKIENDDAPFKIATCDPRNTFVIYKSDVLQTPVLCGVFSQKVDEAGNTTGYDYLVYSDTTQFAYTTDNTTPMLGEFTLTKEPKPHLLAEVPIVEYMNNQWRVGDYEKAISLMDALNVSLSDRVNAIEQTVGSILVYVDCEPDEGGTKALKQRGAVKLKTNGNGRIDIKYISPELLQSDAQVLEDTINGYIDAVTGIPSRSERSGGGGDTGDAVYLRDGYQDLELVVRKKERAFRKGERKTIRLVSRIMRRFKKPFDPREVDVNFVRNRSTNISNKATAASALVSTGIFDPVDVIKIIGVTDQPTEMAARGEVHRLKIEAEKQAAIDKQNKANDAAKEAEADKEMEKPKADAVKTSEE